MGVLLSSSSNEQAVLYVGQFLEGQRSGFGWVVTPRGEGFRGHFLEGVMWGPGVYRFAPPPTYRAADGGGEGGGAPASGAAADMEGPAVGAGQEGSGERQPAAAGPAASRLIYRGFLNGRPAGRGVLTWSDGRQEAGQFDGTNCYEALEAAWLQGVVLVAEDNAQQADSIARDVQQALREHGLWEQAAPLFAAGGWQEGGTAWPSELPSLASSLPPHPLTHSQAPTPPHPPPHPAPTPTPHPSAPPQEAPVRGPACSCAGGGTG